MLRRFWWVLLLVLVSSLYFSTAGGAILDDGGALYAHAARQMIERNDWVTPYANGVRFLDKPPMMYWLMAAAFELFGVSEFSARLPSVLAVLAIGLLLYAAGRRASGAAAGFIAGIAGTFSIGTFLFTRMVFPDILLVFWITLALSAWLYWYLKDDESLLPAMLFYAALAGAVLTKGLIGAFFPSAAVVLFLAWSRGLSRLRRFHPVKGSLLFLALVLPWHVLASWRNPGFLWYFFVNEQLLRFLGRRQPADYESISLLVFWALLLVWLFPWSVFLPSVWQLIKAARGRSPAGQAVIRLSVTWALVVAVFFSFSTRIEHYALPLLPPLALLIGIALAPDPEPGGKQRHWIANGFRTLGCMGGAAAALVAILLVWMSWGRGGETADGIASRHLHAYGFYFAPLLDFPPQILSDLRLPLVGAVSVFSFGLLGAWWTNRRGRPMAAVLTLTAMMAVFCMLSHLSLGVCEPVLSSKYFAGALSPIFLPGDALIVVGDYETANSLNFYLPAPLEVCGGTAAVLRWGLSYPDAPDRVVSLRTLGSRWRGAQRIFLLAPDGEMPELGPAVYPILSWGGRSLVCNQPVRIRGSE